MRMSPVEGVSFDLILLCDGQRLRRSLPEQNTSSARNSLRNAMRGHVQAKDGFAMNNFASQAPGERLT